MNKEEIINLIQLYALQMKQWLEDDIDDYLDDDRIGNRDIIVELKDDLQKWNDILDLCNGEGIDELNRIDIFLDNPEYLANHKMENGKWIRK